MRIYSWEQRMTTRIIDINKIASNKEFRVGMP